MELDETIRRRLLTFQRTELTEHHIYRRLAKVIRPVENQQVLEQIARDELRHYQDWKRYTGQETEPDRLKMWFYYWVSHILGFTFGVKLMERGEEAAQQNYEQITDVIPEAATFKHEEDIHEQKLLAKLDEEHLRYAGSVVLGLNDALVELTGALAGLTLALQNTRLIALTGLITGIAASLSMAASEYLATRSEKTEKHPLRAAVYTGIAYIFTVVFLILPYVLLENYYICLAVALSTAVLIIALFNYYISVAKDESFRERFIEMAGVSLGVAGLSFVIGYLIRILLGIEV
jgi:VIT1/CCC1 family predicted Fe2+/Mn2+ transporter